MKSKSTAKLEDLIATVKLLHQKMQKEGKAALKEAFAGFFEDHPEAKAIVWTQYTPHFNDGETCEFGVNELELKVDPAFMAEDIKKIVGADSDPDEEGDYAHGDGCFVSALGNIIDSPDNRRYLKESWSAANRFGLELRLPTEAEQDLVDDFNALRKACRGPEIEQVLEMVLGDHVRVVANRDGFETFEYEHD